MRADWEDAKLDAMARGLEVEQVATGGVPSARCESPGTDFWFVGSGQHEMLNWFCLAGAVAELGLDLQWSEFVGTDVFNSNKCFAVFEEAQLRPQRSQSPKPLMREASGPATLRPAQASRCRSRCHHTLRRRRSLRRPPLFV